MNISVKPNVSCTGLAARNWMIHMNPIAKNSFEASPTNPEAPPPPTKAAAAALAAMAFGSVTRKKSRKDRRASNASYPSELFKNIYY